MVMCLAVNEKDAGSSPAPGAKTQAAHLQIIRENLEKGAYPLKVWDNRALTPCVFMLR